MADPTTEIGPNIRQRRKRLGLSLEALAKASGVSSTMLSEVERGVKNPTVKLAYQIARALGCSLTDLLEPGPVRVAEIVRASERRSLVDPQSQVVRHGLRTQLLGDQLEVAFYELPPGSTTGTMEANHSGIVEHVSVTAGRLCLWLGSSQHQLEVGDSAAYGAHQTMEYKNEGDVVCTFVLLSDRSRAGAK